MLAIAGQTAKPNWLIFFEETLKYPVNAFFSKFFQIYFKFQFFLQNFTGTPGTSDSLNIKLKSMVVCFDVIIQKLS